MARVFTTAAPEQARAMLAVLEQRHPGRREALRTETLAELGAWPEIQIRMVPESGGGGRCSVAGSYDDETVPPTVHVGQARSLRRQGFTALHELGHHLQQTDPDLGDRLFDWSDSEALEEAACDAFAARILLPESQLPDHLRERGPTAADVVALFESSRASREACCVRASEFIISSGTVVLLDTDGTVVFAARHGMIPPARGSDQAATPLVRAALKSRGSAQVDRTHILFRDGHRGEDLYGQADWMDQDYLVAVLGVDQVAWRRFTAPRPGTGTNRFRSGWICETCHEGFTVSGDCEQCRQPQCPQGHCGCTAARAAADPMCTRCYLKKSTVQFPPGSTICRDCLE
ncbi:ImmA/IrrE family metallo-endopeptidase [Actinacidiphila sp. DG2A-62]|uniref:ImmA/IrrE family metallo-endopeptidase n=1 Tax=Actinacidiphila sp. DG2A-62 TaxID=3108821 RepID=UPI002DBE563D|nr:ImmA/IrrE family metallo-endopeptidase [Actinacidiphila sp. DG2A-62]MEC3998893.1 ImmA/IrrE family metallo-endopeptidase [Actinacidiphila sp. DG2A-62]